MRECRPQRERPRAADDHSRQLPQPFVTFLRFQARIPPREIKLGSARPVPLAGLETLVFPDLVGQQFVVDEPPGPAQPSKLPLLRLVRIQAVAGGSVHAIYSSTDSTQNCEDPAITTPP